MRQADINFQFFQSLILSIINLGTEKEFDLSKVYQIKFVNIIALMLVVISVLFMIAFILFIPLDKNLGVFVGNLVTSIICSLSGIYVLWSSKKLRFDYAKNIMFVCIYILVFLANILYDRSSGEFFYFVFLPMIIFYLFGLSKKTAYLLFSTLLLLLGTMINSNINAPLLELSKESEFEMFLINLLIVMSGLIVALYFQFRTNAKILSKIKEISLTDPLTKLSNRYSLDLYIKTIWDTATRVDFPISIIMCDIDFFKQYNDTYGHIKGDECLIEVANTIKGFTSRRADMVSRYGGEEFILVLSNSDIKQASEMASKICSTIEELKIEHNNSPINSFITLSCGVATKSKHQDMSYKELVRRADKALYDAKKMGRNKVVVHSLT